MVLLNSTGFKGKSQNILENNLNPMKAKTYQKLLDAAKSVIRGNFIVLHEHLEKEDRFKSNHLRFLHKC